MKYFVAVWDGEKQEQRIISDTSGFGLLSEAEAWIKQHVEELVNSTSPSAMEIVAKYRHQCFYIVRRTNLVQIKDPWSNASVMFEQIKSVRPMIQSSVEIRVEYDYTE